MEKKCSKKGLKRGGKLKIDKFKKRVKIGGGCESAIFEHKVSMINLCNKTIV